MLLKPEQFNSTNNDPSQNSTTAHLIKERQPSERVEINKNHKCLTALQHKTPSKNPQSITLASIITINVSSSTGPTNRLPATCDCQQSE